jgi:hypothetical protein
MYKKENKMSTKWFSFHRVEVAQISRLKPQKPLFSEIAAAYFWQTVGVEQLPGEHKSAALAA